MTSHLLDRVPGRRGLLAITLATCLAGVAVAKPESRATPAAPVALRTFASADEAAAALLKACGADAREELVAMFGAKELERIETSDAAQNQLMRKRFAEMGAERLRLVPGANGATKLVVGEKEWPFPIPIVATGERFRFDAAAGAQELIDRRIGRNELEVIASLRAWLEAEAEYAAEDHDGDEVREYAQRLTSTPGHEDGLYWEVPEGSSKPQSPLGPLVRGADPDAVAASAAGSPWHGYRMRILTRQGAHAPGGAHPYALNGNMVAGCAIVAWPAEHGRTGIMTFIVSHHGKMYQRDLGPDTTKAIARVTSFDPGPGWTEVPPPVAAGRDSGSLRSPDEPSRDGRAVQAASANGAAEERAVSLFSKAPDDWKPEIIPFPLGFAPEIAGTGTEELRFAPGMFDPASELYFTYAFTWRLEGRPPLDRAALETDLLKYYQGLYQAVSRSEHQDVSAFSVKLQPGTGDRKLQGSVHWRDPFVTERELALNLLATTWSCDEGHAHLLLLLSPQPPGSRAWDLLATITPASC